jgi:pimeloyl-ACP methyl ester carboxylesterase
MAPTPESGASQMDDTHDDRTVRDEGHYIEIVDTQLFVEERGRGYPLLVLHGAPGVIDHRFFGNYLDPLCDRYRLILVDARGQGQSAAYSCARRPGETSSGMTPRYPRSDGTPLPPTRLAHRRPIAGDVSMP